MRRSAEESLNTEERHPFASDEKRKSTDAKKPDVVDLFKAGTFKDVE